MLTAQTRKAVVWFPIAKATTPAPRCLESAPRGYPAILEDFRRAIVEKNIAKEQWIVDS
jgi:hypothetical protein